MALEMADQELTADEWAESSRARFGLTLEKLPSTIQRRDDYATHEHDALQTLADAGVDAKVVKSLYHDFYSEIRSGVGTLSPGQLDILERKYAPKIGEDVAAALRRWYENVQRGAR